MSRIAWSLHIVSNEHALEQSYTVLFFLGDVSASVEDWRTADSLLGLHVSHTYSGHNPPEDSDDHPIESFIALQRALKRRSGLPKFTPDVVVPYLHDNVHWRIQKVDGDVVDNKDLPSLKVVVFSMTDEQKRAGERTEYPL